MVRDIPKFFFPLTSRKRETHGSDILKIRFSLTSRKRETHRGIFRGPFQYLLQAEERGPNGSAFTRIPVNGTACAVLLHEREKTLIIWWQRGNWRIRYLL